MLLASGSHDILSPLSCSGVPGGEAAANEYACGGRSARPPGAAHGESIERTEGARSPDSGICAPGYIQLYALNGCWLALLRSNRCWLSSSARLLCALGAGLRRCAAMDSLAASVLLMTARLNIPTERPFALFEDV